LLAFLDAEPGVEYVVAMAKNAVLKRKAKPAMRHARKLSRRSGKTEHVYGEANYAARTWPRERRILIKAEVVRAFVAEGGGVVMVGGYLTFSGVDAKARWGRTSLAQALPVRILDIDDRVELPAGAQPSVVAQHLVRWVAREDLG